MSRKHYSLKSPKVVAAIHQLKSLIRAEYPDAQFRVFEGDDPCGIYLEAIVNLENTSDAIMPVLDALDEIQGEQELPIYVVTDKPRDKVEAELKARLEEIRANPPSWLPSWPGHS